MGNAFSKHGQRRCRNVGNAFSQRGQRGYSNMEYVVWFSCDCHALLRSTLDLGSRQESSGVVRGRQEPLGVVRSRQESLRVVRSRQDA